jgi:DNA-binding protein H-NS
MFALNIPTASNIAELLSQKAELEAAVKKNKQGLNLDRHLFIDHVHELIKTFDIRKTEAFPPIGKSAIVDKDYSPDYFFRDPKTGEEWDGKGKRPGYLSGKKKTNDFRIYHATGTKFAPVVKPSPAKSEFASAGGMSPLTIVPTAPIVVAVMPEPQSPDVRPADHHQPVRASSPVSIDQSASDLHTHATAEAAAIPS